MNEYIYWSEDTVSAVLIFSRKIQYGIHRFNTNYG